MLRHIQDLIPVIEENKNGYYEIYVDADNHLIKKIWHQNPKIKYKDIPSSEEEDINQELNIMANETLKAFQEKKRAESDFITLSGDGESVSGIVKEIKQLSKVGFGGKEVEVIRLVLETENGVKFFDKGTKQWVNDLLANEVDVGSDITIIRHGIKDDKKTIYEIVKNVSK